MRPPGIHNRTGYAPFDQGLAQGVFINLTDGRTPYIGTVRMLAGPYVAFITLRQVWPGTTAYPDFTNPATVTYWKNQIQGFLQLAPVDGLWIDMNEPSNFDNRNGGTTYWTVRVGNLARPLTAATRMTRRTT
jgi:lysosomal alpha-glucosidase